MQRGRFELQGRVEQPFDLLKHALSTPTMLRAAMTMGFGHDGLLVLQAPFRPASYPNEHALHAPAALTSSRGRTLGLVRFELTAWSADESSLSVRPLTSRPDRWSPRRGQQYFTLARLSLDAVARILDEEVAPHFAVATTNTAHANHVESTQDRGGS